MTEYRLSYHAKGTTGTANFQIIAESEDQAKDIWNDFIEDIENKNDKYTYDQACKGAAYHTGGYVKWQTIGESDKTKGCYKLDFNNWNAGSDHLRD